MAASDEGPSGKTGPSWLRRKWPGLALVVAGALLQVIFGRFGEIDCTRIPDRVMCVHRTALLGVVPLSERVVYVLHAEVKTDCRGDGCDFRVELTTTDGIVPLQDTWWGDLEAEADKVQRINAFLAGDQPHFRIGLRVVQMVTALLPSLVWILGVLALALDYEVGTRSSVSDG